MGRATPGEAESAVRALTGSLINSRHYIALSVMFLTKPTDGLSELARLKHASDALDAAQDASQTTTREIAHAQRAVETATAINGIHKPQTQGQTERARKRIDL
jgi:hypothetical protein